MQRCVNHFRIILFKLDKSTDIVLWNYLFSSFDKLTVYPLAGVTYRNWKLKMLICMEMK
jgi:hypothetical protein